VEVISVLKAIDDTDTTNAGETKTKAGGRGRINTLLNGALSAGKAARNEQVVPDIKKLKEYGSDGTPPSSLANVVAKVRQMSFSSLQSF
jgi:hypothetical protein